MAPLIRMSAPQPTSARLEPSDDGLPVCGTTRQTCVHLDYKPATQASPCDRVPKTPNHPTALLAKSRSLPFLAVQTDHRLMSDSGPALACALAQFSSTWFLDPEFDASQLVAGLEQVHRPDSLGTASSGVSASRGHWGWRGSQAASNLLVPDLTLETPRAAGYRCTWRLAICSPRRSGAIV